MMVTVSIIIPTLNERYGIGLVLDDLPIEELEGKGYDVEVLVVDGGSSDGTQGVVVEKGYELIVEEGGKASAVRRGLEESSGRYVFTIDGDGSYPADKIVDMVSLLEDGNDMVMGSRFMGVLEVGAMTRVNKVGNRFLTWFGNRLYGTSVTDICTGLRGIDRESLDGVELPGEGFEIEAGIHTVFCDNDVEEIPIYYEKRAGSSKLKVWDGLHIAKRLLIERYR